MQGIIKYVGIITTALTPSVALALTTPGVPGGITGGALTGSGVVSIINNAVNLLLGVSTVIAIGYFVYGAVRYAMGNKDAGGIMQNAAIGLAFILGVGLIVNTIAGFINRGLNLG